MGISSQATTTAPGGRKRRATFVERTIASLAAAIERALAAEELARADGLLQRVDPRVKVAGILGLIVVGALARNLYVIAAFFAVAVGLALLSHVPVRMLAGRVWIGALVFTGILALPAVFITPGRVAYRVPLLNWPVTEQGLTSAVFLVSRVETAATLSLLLILCTPWTHVLKALRVLRVPIIFVVILGMTYRYIFLMLQTAMDMFEARQSRMVGRLEGPERRRLAAASVGVLLGKSFALSSEVYLAMQSRGFRGEVYTLDDFKMRTRDWIAVIGVAALAGLGLWFGH